MKTLGDNEESAKARYEIERATIDCAEMSLFIDDVQAATLARGNFEFGVEWGKLIFAWWDEGVSQSWRVTAYEIDRGELRLRGTRGMGRETTLLTLRDLAKWLEIRGRENLPPGERRRRYAETLSRLITKMFNGARVERVTTGSFRPRSGVGRYARLVLKSDGETVLAIGVGEAESQDGVDGLAAAGLVALAAFNEKRDGKDQAKRLWLCLPKGRSQSTVERLTLLDVSRLGAQIECFEVDECGEEMAGVRAVTQDELLNSHPREVIWPGASTPDEKWRERIVNLAPDLIETRRDSRSGRERFEIKGLEFALLGAGGQVKFGVVGGRSEGLANLVALTESNFGALEALVREIVRYRSADCLDRRHPFYSLRAEAWLESLLRRDIRRLDATLDERFVYSQIPAWRADERSVIDLLTVNHEGRLAVIEIKAAEDPQLPLQGTDYWLRVEQGRLRNEFKKRGLFEGIAIADRSPLLYLVAPRLRFHRTFETVAQCVSPRIEAYRIGVNANWREGVKVHTRERINECGLRLAAFGNLEPHGLISRKDVMNKPENSQENYSVAESDNPQSENPQSPYQQSQDGVLVIDKPEGLTSHDVVARVRKILGTRRVGHAGTLDPFATGVLVVCVNRATRLVQFLTGDDKEYVATMRLGFATDTGDLTGTPKTPVTDAGNITSDKVIEAFSRFLGPIKQIPPMYSAKKVGGVKLYEMARRGEEIERAPIVVEIKKLELFKPPARFEQGQADLQTAPDEFSFRVACSSGTYIRALAEDIGALLGVGAHLTRLRRIRSGNCSLDSAVTLEELADLARSGHGDRVMIPMADTIMMPALRVGAEERERVSHGRSIEPPEGCRADYANGALVKLCDKKNQLIAIAEFDSSKTLWRPRVVLTD